MSTSYLFSFAAKGLQTYIMRGGKLRDMVGATSLIDKLSSEDQLREWLTGPFGVPAKAFEILQAAAGSARIRFYDKEAAETVNRLWPLWRHAWAPGLDVVQHLKTWDDAEQNYAQAAARSSDQLERNRILPFAKLPEAGPFVKRAPRTGEPAVEQDAGDEDKLIDLSIARKRAERRALKKGGALPPVASAFGFTDAGQLAEEFSQISGLEGAYLAVVHADGNRLGQMFMSIEQAMKKCTREECPDETAIALFQFLSVEVVAEGTRRAVAKAMRALKVAAAESLNDPNTAWPIAPIVLAGDDLTAVCRADLGLPFAEAFLKAFCDETGERLGWLRSDGFPQTAETPDKFAKYRALWGRLPAAVKAPIPESLSGGAGVVFCTDHYPFSLAYALCESVAKQAKDRAKAIFADEEKAAKARGEKNPRSAPPSALSFVRITGASVPTEFEDLARGILRGEDGTLLTCCPYFVDGADKPQYDSLRAVYDRSKPGADSGGDDRKTGLPSGSLRNLLNLQRTDASKLSEAAERMKEVAGGNEERKKAWDEFEKAWDELTEGAGWKTLQTKSAGEAANGTNGKRSPLLDLLTLLAIRDKDAGVKSTDLSVAPSNP